MSTRVQVILPDDERERFTRRAAREGLSLSAWMRRAARDHYAASPGPELPRDADALSAFFAACDRREQGREPDWEEHLRVIGASRASGVGGS